MTKIPHNEDEAELLIEEHLREHGWDITDFSQTRKRWREHLDGKEADRVFLNEGKVVAILEAKQPGKDLWAALEEAKGYARIYKKNTGNDITFIFASDGKAYLRQNLKANTLPERIPQFPTPLELKEIFTPQVKNLNGILRDYQRIAVSQVVASVQAGRRRMYLQMATGTGKTITAAGIIAKLSSIGLIRKALFLVDRDALAEQTLKKFKNHLGDNFKLDRAKGTNEDKYRDILITTVQHLAAHKKYLAYKQDHFSLVVLDECHRSYFGDWYGVLDHFAQGGAILLGLTATPADKETINTDRFFTDLGQYQGPVYRYTIRQGETNPEVPQWDRLAGCTYHKFLTNVDLEGVHDMGFDFEPDQLGKAVDVPERNRLIAEKYFEVIQSKELVKTIVFAASIAHAKNLRYALIEKYNELNNLPPNDATAEKFIVTVHNEMANASKLIDEFQKVTDESERKAIIKQAREDPNMESKPIILVGIGMLDTGIDAPDVEVLLMARPTKSKILYVQMKGRGTRKCVETSKEFYKLVDFVDISRLEAVVTNETPGVVDEPVEQEEEEIIKHEREEKEKKHVPREEGSTQEMVIADVPVYLVFSTTLAPSILQELRLQIEEQLKDGLQREGLKQRFVQTVLCWRFVKGNNQPETSYLSAMGFDLSTLRDIYGEPEATLEDFVSVAMGEADFDTLTQRRIFEQWAKGKKISKEQQEIIGMVCDFKKRNSTITATQILHSQWLEQKGGLPKIKALFGNMNKLLALVDEALELYVGTSIEEEKDNGKST